MKYDKRPLTSAEFHKLEMGGWRRVPWRDLIASDHDRLIVAIGYSPNSGREHRYIGGPPPLRIKRMQLAHETRARKAGVPYDLIDLRDVLKHWDYRCGICAEPVTVESFTIDHIIPIEAGGAHLFENLQPAHSRCNSVKGRRIPNA